MLKPLINRCCAVHRLLCRSLATQKMSINEAESIRYKQKIIEETKVSRAHLTPEIALHLITPECRLYHEPVKHDHESEKVFASDPFWAFYWPGGQALTRFILDNPEIVKDKRALDVGSGCGATSLAALKNGAKYVVANDIDKVASYALQLNAALNDLSTKNLRISTKNLIGSNVTEEIIFLGDIFYDGEIAEQLFPWLRRQSNLGKNIFIGDPGRHGLKDTTRLNFLSKLITYELPENCCIENHGFKNVNVWKVLCN